MNSMLRSIAARIGRPVLAPVRSQMYAWIDYRIRIGGDPADQLKRAWTRDASAGPMPVSFSEVVPALLNAISCTNAAAREGKRREIELHARIDALEAEMRELRTLLGQRGTPGAGRNAA